jgi:CheY-like chemotaxis protein
MEAIAVLLSATEPFDIVLMDCEMPEMDGFETSRSILRLQKEKRLPSTPIVALTAHAVPDKIQACHDAGMVGHLAKPINMERLRNTLRQILRDPDIRLTSKH